MMYTGRSVSAPVVDFARKAHAYFVEHPESHSFTEGDLILGELIALRWAFDRTQPATVWSVVVFQIGSIPVLVEDL